MNRLAYDSGEELWQVSDNDTFYEFKTTSDESRKFRRKISAELMDHYGKLIGDDNYFEFEYCFFELVNNAISKGNCFDETKTVRLYYAFSDKIFRVLIEDEGSGFNIGKWNVFYGLRKDKERFLKIDITKTGDTNIEKTFLNDSSFNSLDKDSEIDILDTLVSGGTGLVSVVDYYDKVFYNKDDVDISKNTKVLAVKFFNKLS